MKRHGSIFPCLFLASALSAAPLSPGWLANPPPEDPVPEDCECRCGCCETVSDGCTMVKADLGSSTPESGSVPLSLEIRFDAEAWDVFRRDRLLMAYDGFGFSRLGQGRKQDGATPSEVFIARPDGSLAKFRFAEDATIARPAPSLRGGMAERLAMTDADGAATTSSPAHYELHMGDGTMRRFDATPDACGNYGALESVRTAQGRVVTPFGMGVDVVRDFDGVRQVLAPSRLAEYAGTVPISCEGPESMSK